MRVFSANALFVAVVACGIVPSTGAQSPQTDHTLDLTSPAVLRTPPVVRGGGGVARSGQASPTPLPLRLRLVQLDRSTYELGNPIVYEVELTNVGSRPIGLPWSADLELITQPGRSFIQSTLFLSVGDRPEREIQLATTMLGGSTSVRDSIQTIRPGEVARIKVASTINAPPQSQLAGSSVPAHVVYRFNTGLSVDWEDLRSVNALPIEFQRPR